MLNYIKNLFLKNAFKFDAEARKVMTFDLAQPNPNNVIFAVGDLHGSIDLLNEKIEIIENRIQEFGLNSAYQFHIVFLGDYIDRGQNTKHVIERLMNLKFENGSLHCLMGNHEDILLKFISNPEKYIGLWMSIGGASTLNDFEIHNINENAAQVRDRLVKKMGPKILTYLTNLETSYENGDYFFCHAVPRSDVALADQKKTVLINNRKEKSPSYEKIVIHGHVSTDKVNYAGSKINIDTGAYATQNLTCLLLYNHNQIVL